MNELQVVLTHKRTFKVKLRMEVLIIRETVDANGNPDYQGVDTSFLVATLTAAIQEQQAIISDLKARIEALEA
jgi:hypothetical protein